MVNLRKKSFQMAFCLTFLIALFCLCQTKVAAQEKTVKVGYMDYNGFIQEYDDGTFYGYGVDYLEEISKYTGWKYEYVYGSWPVIMEKLQKGEIDLLCTAQKLDSRLESFDFSILLLSSIVELIIFVSPKIMLFSPITVCPIILVLG